MRNYGRITVLLPALMMTLLSSGCSSDSADHSKQADQCLEALSAVQSTDSLYAKIELTGEADGETEDVSDMKYWKDGSNLLYYTAVSSDETGGKLWYLYVDGNWYARYTHEVDNAEADQWGYDWMEVTDSTPNNVAFWEGITQTEDQMEFVSGKIGGEKSILTFQVKLSDEDRQLSDAVYLNERQYVFTLDGEGNLSELEVRYDTTETFEGTEREVLMTYSAVFADGANGRSYIEAEAQKAASGD